MTGRHPGMTGMTGTSDTSGTTGEARGSGRCRDDRGTALIEVCLVMPLLLTLVTGIIDYGFLFRQLTALRGVVHSSLRTAAASGASRNADHLTLSSLSASFASTRHLSLTKVVIYRPLAEGSELPVDPDCMTSSAPPVGADCNVYTAAQVATIGDSASAHFGPDASCGPTAWDTRWCPLGRNDDAYGPPDWIGIQVEVVYHPITGFWMPSGYPLVDRAVIRIEPRNVAA